MPRRSRSELRAAVTRDEHVPPTAEAGPVDPTRSAVASAAPRGPYAAGSSSSVPASPAVNRADRYQILGEHARGGLGRISRARDRELERDVAIKELITRSHIGEVRFLREALITARLEHPGIVPVHEAGRWPDGTPFYAMKLVAGRPLRDLIAERTTVDERLGLLHHVIAVADAIAYAHDHQIIHRDLKPGNVIVGDFGETVVIDWGLAKDLSVDDGPTVAAASGRQVRGSDLTNTGSVLGTPAYMAPEQARGEHVDQRADVYAIGAMLWELCALPRVAPDDRPRRHHLLRRAGIDRDLITIIDKALAPDPAARYASAGALALDLKAFKAGTRIAARSYSLAGLLAHWTRRHRALAAAVVALAVVAVLAAIGYVTNIATERDRADAALARTRAAQNDLTLEHAELLLRSDPTAAVATLATYRGNDELRRQRLLAEARGLGFARQTLSLHTDTVFFVHGRAGGEIVSLGEDSRLVSTRGRDTTVLASDVSRNVRISYTADRELLAYATSPTGLAVIRLADRQIVRIPAIDPLDLALAPDGSRLAAINERGEIVVWSLAARAATEIARRPIAHAARLTFATAGRLVVQAGDTLAAIAIDEPARQPDVAAIANVSTVDARADLVAIGTRDGTVELLSANLAPKRSIATCHARVNNVLLIPGKHEFAFFCQDNRAGLMRFDDALVLVETFPTQGYSFTKPQPADRYIAYLDGSATGYLYDLETRIVHRYTGHGGQVTFLAGPTAACPQIVTGDGNGTVRTWDPWRGDPRILFRAPEPLYALSVASTGALVLANGYEPTTYGADGATGASFELAGEGELSSQRIAPDSSSMLSYGENGSVQVWRTRDRALLRRFKPHHGSLGEVDYLDAQHLVSVGADGKLLRWSPDGDAPEVLFTTAHPLLRLEVLAGDHHVVVFDSEGGVWDVALDHTATQVRAADGAVVTLLRASPDGKLLAIGNARGRVEVYATSTWRRLKTLQMDGEIQQIMFDPRGRDLAIASQAHDGRTGHVHLLALDGTRTYHWTDVTAPARDLAYTPDGDALGFVSGGGSIWLYSMTTDVWAYANDEHADTLTAGFSADGRWFLSSDRNGAVILRDVAKSLATTPPPGPP